jgi:hypothetical protein
VLVTRYGLCGLELALKAGEWGEDLALDFRAVGHKTWRTIASIQTGVVLLILVVTLAAVGTVVLQRSATESDEMQSAYSPQRAEPLSHSRVHQVGPRQSNSNDRNTEINGAFSSSPPRSRQGAAASESERRCMEWDDGPTLNKVERQAGSRRRCVSIPHG